MAQHSGTDLLHCASVDHKTKKIIVKSLTLHKENQKGFVIKITFVFDRILLPEISE